MLIDAFADDWWEYLCARVRELDGSEQLHLLIDGAFVPGLHAQVALDRKVLLFESLAACGDATRDASPFVTPFVSNDRAMRALLLRCDGWPMVSVIRTSEDLQSLGARLAAWCVVEADGQRFHLRLADTRRIPAIVHALHPDQRAQLLGPAVSWTYMTRHGQWHALPCDGVAAEPASSPSFDDQQFGMLVEDSRIDEMLALFARHDPHPPRWRSSQQHAAMSLALEAALGAQLSESELLGWCEFVWKEGQIDTSGSVADKFARWQAMR